MSGPLFSVYELTKYLQQSIASLAKNQIDFLYKKWYPNKYPSLKDKSVSVENGKERFSSRRIVIWKVTKYKF